MLGFQVLSEYMLLLALLAKNDWLLGAFFFADPPPSACVVEMRPRKVDEALKLESML